MRGPKHIEIAFACALAVALAVALAGCSQTNPPAGGDALALAPDVPVVVQDVVDETSPDVGDVSVEVIDVGDVEIQPAPDTETDAEEVADLDDVSCVPGIDPQDPCWYCKCTDDGKKCFPLGSGSSCTSDNCCMLNTICQPCEAYPDLPCGPESWMVCVGGPSLACDSSDPCTSSTLECLSTGCQCSPEVTPDGTACVYDPDLCTENDACLGGTCLPGEQVNMGDGNPCTQGMCVKGEVYQHPLSGGCTDGNACTVNDHCQAGVCTPGLPAVCLVGSCDATATCDPSQGCVTTPKAVGASCSPGGGDGCGLCTGEGWCMTDGDSCDDGEFCTDTLCIGNDDCIFVPNNNACDDGDPCTYGDYCADGFCHSGPPQPCGDDNLCTDDVCVGGACVNTPNSNLCNDEDACTVQDTCQVALPPCPGPFGQPLVIHHVLIQGWKALIRYSKVYPECAELRDLSGGVVVPALCESGECIDVELPNSEFPAAMGDNLKFCLENTGICTVPTLVDQPSGAGYCAGSSAVQLLCDDDDFCTTDSCAPDVGCIHTPISPCGDLTLIYDATGVSESVDGTECAGELTQIQCTPGSVAVGYTGKAGPALDEFRLRCRHLQPDGDLGMATLTAPLGTGAAGEAFGPLSCPGDAIMIGATVHASTTLHSVHGHCQAPDSVALEKEGFIAFAPQAGGAGGAAKAINCPLGYAVTGMKGPANAVACAMQFICTRIDML